MDKHQVTSFGCSLYYYLSIFCSQFLYIFTDITNLLKKYKSQLLYQQPEEGEYNEEKEYQEEQQEEEEEEEEDEEKEDLLKNDFLPSLSSTSSLSSSPVSSSLFSSSSPSSSSSSPSITYPMDNKLNITTRKIRLFFDEAHLERFSMVETNEIVKDILTKNKKLKFYTELDDYRTSFVSYF